MTYEEWVTKYETLLGPNDVLANGGLFIDKTYEERRDLINAYPYYADRYFGTEEY